MYVCIYIYIYIYVYLYVCFCVCISVFPISNFQSLILTEGGLEVLFLIQKYFYFHNLIEYKMTSLTLSLRSYRNSTKLSLISEEGEMEGRISPGGGIYTNVTFNVSV